MPQDTDRKATLLHADKQPLVLVGPPRQIRGEFRLQNATDRKIVVREPRLKAAMAAAPRAKAGKKGAAAGDALPAASIPDVSLGLRRIVVRAGSSKPVPLALALDPRTPPGTYQAQLDIDGEQRSVLMHVTEDVALNIAPHALVLTNAPGTKVQKQIVLTNDGNVAVTVKSIGAVVLDDELAHCRALRGALSDVGQTMKTLDDFAAALGRRYRDIYETAALRVQNDEVTLAPGETRAIDLTITLPEKLERRSRYTASAAISTGTLTFTIVPD